MLAFPSLRRYNLCAFLAPSPQAVTHFLGPTKQPVPGYPLQPGTPSDTVADNSALIRAMPTVGTCTAFVVGNVRALRCSS